VVATASYEARRFGVASAMPISKAWRLCPHGAYVPPDMGKYARVSDEVMEILGRYTDCLEPISIDEAFLDVTGSRRAFGDGETIARSLKEAIRAETALTASVGVAPSKLGAKIASDLRKPDGLVVVAPGGEAALLAPLPVRRLWGVGPKMEEVLARLGVATIGDLARLDPSRLEHRLGTHGHDLLRLAQGIDDRPVVADREAAKSIGHETTFDVDTADLPRLRQTVLDLSDSVAARLRAHGVRGRTVTLKYRDEDFATITRAETMPTPTDAGNRIFEVAWRLFEKARARPAQGAAAGRLAFRPGASPAGRPLHRGGLARGQRARCGPRAFRERGAHPRQPARPPPGRPAAAPRLGAQPAVAPQQAAQRQAHGQRRLLDGHRGEVAVPAHLPHPHAQQQGAAARGRRRRFHKDEAMETFAGLHLGRRLLDLRLDLAGQARVPVAQLVHQERHLGHGSRRSGERRPLSRAPWAGAGTPRMAALQDPCPEGLSARAAG
jgi:nucleotidyltransferase/DNA polymerase involved in DNA repair